LTCISFIFHRVFPVIIHNQRSDFELVSSTYFGHNAIWIRSPDQKVDANTVARAIFGRDVSKLEFMTALLYKLQRKKRLESNDQSNVDNTSAEGSSTSLQLLVIWGTDRSYRHSTYTLLIKHSNTIVWNEDELKKLHSAYCASFGTMFQVEPFCFAKYTWLLDDAPVLMTTLELGKVSRAIEITISEGIRKDDTKAPLCIL
jgi:hypothetical protein